jgi:hypothetical protein
MEGLTNLQAEGFGVSSIADLGELRKALDIGYQMPATGTGFDALRVESLESTLKLLTYNATNIKLWNMIPKTDAFSTVEEYNRLLEYGSAGGGFTQSGELPQEEDSTYERTNQLVKYLGTTRAVNHPATLVRTVPADIIAQETSNGALWLMGKANNGLYYADSDAVPVEWNSLTKQIEGGAGHVIDCEGAPLTKEQVELGAYLVAENFGVPMKLFSNNKVFSDFSNYYNQYQRFSAPSGQAGVVGTPITGVSTSSGVVGFEPDTFVKTGNVPLTSANSTKAPNTPVLTPSSATGTSAPKFKTTDAGDYKYAVSAVNQYGESAATALSSAVTVAATQKVPLSIADGGGTFPATAYKIYRTEKNGTIAYFIGYALPRAKSSGVYINTTTWDDVNAYRPNTFIGLMLDLTQQSLTFKQLSPMIKMQLAIVSPSIRWMQLLYGTPIVFAPKKNVVFRNIGKSSG